MTCFNVGRKSRRPCNRVSEIARFGGVLAVSTQAYGGSREQVAELIARAGVKEVHLRQAMSVPLRLTRVCDVGIDQAGIGDEAVGNGEGVHASCLLPGRGTAGSKPMAAERQRTGAFVQIRQVAFRRARLGELGVGELG